MIKSALAWTGLAILTVIMFIGIGFGSGKLQALYNRTVGVEVSSSETEKFYKTKGFTEGMVQDLAKRKLELGREEDPTARKAIITYVVEEFANFDESTINSDDLREFLMDCRDGNIE